MEFEPSKAHLSIAYSLLLGLKDKALSECCNGMDAATVRDEFKRRISNGEVFHSDCDNRKPDGSCGHIE